MRCFRRSPSRLSMCSDRFDMHRRPSQNRNPRRQLTMRRRNRQTFTNSYSKRYNESRFFRRHKITFPRRYGSQRREHPNMPCEENYDYEPSVASVCIPKHNINQQVDSESLDNPCARDRVVLFKQWALSELYSQAREDHQPLETGMDVEATTDECLALWKKVKTSYVLYLQANMRQLMGCKSKYLNDSNSSTTYKATFQNKSFSLQNIKDRCVFSVIYCHNKFHEGFYDDYSAAIMADNIARNLTMNGILLVVITSASQIFRNITEKGMTFGNDLFTIKFPEKHLEKELPEYGIDFDFKIKGERNREYLIQIPVLEKVLVERGVKIKCRKSMRQIYHEIKNESEKIQELWKFKLLENVSENKYRLTLSDDEKELLDMYEGIVLERM